MTPEYPALPWRVLLGLAWAAALGRHRNFRQDALACTRHLRLIVHGSENIPAQGPGVVLTNHYFRPGFFAPWIALAISASITHELVWVMTAAWTEAGTLGSQLKAAVSVPVFPKLARVYGFIPMPPMPPRPHEVAARATAVRQLLRAAQGKPSPILALAPEGMDSPDGDGLIIPPPGVGRMLAKLAERGCWFYPVGVVEEAKAFVLNFGPRFRLEGMEDRQVSDQAMRAIAELLPRRIRGVYGK